MYTTLRNLFPTATATAPGHTRDLATTRNPRAQSESPRFRLDGVQHRGELHLFFGGNGFSRLVQLLWHGGHSPEFVKVHFVVFPCLGVF
jgi:hypothetical protein